MQDKKKLTKTAEEKRIKDFERIAKNWDKLPEYAQGKMDGIISTYTMLFMQQAR